MVDREHVLVVAATFSPLSATALQWPSGTDTQQSAQPNHQTASRIVLAIVWRIVQ